MDNSKKRLRAIAYVDGFNLYFGMKSKGWGQFYWNDPHALIQAILGPELQLDAVRYFTARVKEPDDKRERQTAFLNALEACSEAEIIYGKFYTKWRDCVGCSASWKTYEEKMTDTAIGVNLVADAFLDAFDVALLVGGDTDIVPAIQMVRRHFPSKELRAWFPPNRKNQEVADACHSENQINGAHLKAACMPDEVTSASGLVIKRPSEWVYVPPEERRRRFSN